MKNSGKVWLVGAGPGDISLLTLKALQCIQQADVIIYDRLVNPKMLEWCSASCTCINVGKSPGYHSVPQEEINSLLIQHARTQRNVVRLKGGDPYVFGAVPKRWNVWSKKALLSKWCRGSVPPLAGWPAPGSR